MRITLLLAFLALTGCVSQTQQTSDPASFDGQKMPELGQTKQEVAAVRGKPDRTRLNSDGTSAELFVPDKWKLAAPFYGMAARCMHWSSNTDRTAALPLGNSTTRICSQQRQACSRMNNDLIIGSEEWFDHFTAPENLDVVEKAKFYIARSTPYIGAFMGTGAVQRFIHDCAVIMEGPAKAPDHISGRPPRNSAEVLAIQLACTGGLRSPESLVGSTYLVVLLESFFREISGLLNGWDGSWKSPNDRIIGGQRSAALARNPGRARTRLSDVEIAYELAVAKDNQSDPRAEHLRDLESKIASETPAPVTQNPGQRIAQSRHSVAHGNPIGADSEGRFYSLLVIMLTFGDPKWSPPV
jgi:hypothetical protein